MQISTRNVVLDVSTLPSCSTPGYALAYLTPAQARAVKAPPSWTVALRIDGSRAELVRLIGAYTAHMATASFICETQKFEDRAISRATQTGE